MPLLRPGCGSPSGSTRSASPRKLPGWLATTATNEVRQLLRQRSRLPVGLPDGHGGGLGTLLDTVPGDEGDHERELIAAEDAERVRAAFRRLDDGCRQVITVLVLTDPPLAYDQASELLGRPIGSLGPTRQTMSGEDPGLARKRRRRPMTNDRMPDRDLLVRISEAFDADLAPIPGRLSDVASEAFRWRRADVALADLLFDSA